MLKSPRLCAWHQGDSGIDTIKMGSRVGSRRAQFESFHTVDGVSQDHGATHSQVWKMKTEMSCTHIHRHSPVPDPFSS